MNYGPGIAFQILQSVFVVLAAPLYHRWYRHMRRPGSDDRGGVRTYPPPAPGAAWAGGQPETNLDDEGSTT